MGGGGVAKPVNSSWSGDGGQLPVWWWGEGGEEWGGEVVVAKPV